MLLAVGISCILVPCFGPLWMNRNRFFWVLRCHLLRREERGSWHILALVFGFLLPLTPGPRPSGATMKCSRILTTFSGFVEVPMWKWNSGAIWRYWPDQIRIHSSALATNEALWESSKRYFAERGNLFHSFTFLGQTTTRILPMWPMWSF